MAMMRKSARGAWLICVGGFSLILFASLSAPAQEDVAETKAATVIDTTPINEPAITDSDRQHWSFLPIRRPPVPEPAARQRLYAHVDSFIAAKLEAKSAELTISPEADRLMLLRRLSLDLLGLPPAPEEIVAFEHDASPDALERLVDRLLASPGFGERYAQYWLDLARFAETDGYEHDKVRPDAWRYRDWVIAALNADLPYDQFIRSQIAGDAEEGSSLATMFCLSGPDMPDINNQLERRHSLMNEMTATVGAVFLGLQFGCAQCHNHKYDPVSQGDFYRLRAIFEPAVPQLKRDTPVSILVDQKEAMPVRFWVRGDHRRPGIEVLAAFPRIASNERGARNVERGTSTLSDNSALRVPRSALAEWLVSVENPLTARVMANRLWQWHFGRGVCTTPNDFGVMGGPVTHPELLDWLASELQGGGWSLKRMHRLIVSSATYRQASTSNVELYSCFPRQRLSGESIRDAMLAAAGLLTTQRGGPGVMPPLPQELVSTLLKNQWSTSKREADHYKRSVYLFARRNLRYPIFEAFDRPDGNASCPVRSRSTTAPQSLLLFNSEFSLLAAQHLALRVLDAEKAKNQRTKEPNETLVDRLYLIALSRRPTVNEMSALEAFLREQRDRLAAEARPPAELALPMNGSALPDPYAAAALVDACLAVLNSNEFLYVD